MISTQLSGNMCSVIAHSTLVDLFVIMLHSDTLFVLRDFFGLFYA